jgi:hypothetical protein
MWLALASIVLASAIRFNVFLPMAHRMVREE